jgi:hypothetical protein
MIDIEIDELRKFLADAARDASARAGDLDRVPLNLAFADAEIALIDKLEQLVEADETTQEFVACWRRQVENADPIQYPQKHGIVVSADADEVWTLGCPKLKSPVTFFDALVNDETIKVYRLLGQL